jgi:hypothetical protein
VRDREAKRGLDRRGAHLALDAADDRGHRDERARREQCHEVVGQWLIVAR